MTGEIAENEKEILRASTEIIKGIVSNPNVIITYNNRNNLYFRFDDGNSVNLESLYEDVITGVKQGIDRF